MTKKPPIRQGLNRERTLPSNIEEARRYLEELESVLRAHGLEERDTFSIVMAVEEALINAIKHGNQLDPSKFVRVSIRLEATTFEVEISDDGPGFDPGDVPDPTEVENLERPCGRGLLMMRHYMSVVRYSKTGNSVFMQRSVTRS